MENLSPGLPNYMFPLSIMLEEADENEITLDDDRPATGFPSSSPNVTFSPDFNDLVCGQVDHSDISYSNHPTVAIVRVINAPPSSWNYDFSIVSQTQEEHDNISVFEESDNEGGLFTLVKEDTCHEFIVTHLHSVF